MATLKGTNAPDRLFGGETRDKIFGYGGADVLVGNGGNDVIKAGDGSDYLDGGDGNDKLFGGDDEDWLVGGQGNDIIDGGNTGNDYDTVFYGSFGGLAVGVTVNLATGVAIDEFGATDTLIDIEEIIATSFDDILTGGNTANDAFESFRGGDGADVIDGGSGFDRADYAFDYKSNGFQGIIADLAAGTVRDGFGKIDTVTNIEAIRGSVRNDDLRGDNQDNRFEPLTGYDYIDGRGGQDEVSYSSDLLFTDRSGGRVGIRADLRDGEVRDTSGYRVDTLISIEDIRGSFFDDDIRGDNNANRLRGYEGDDFISGRKGNDDLQGENGQDFIFGGSGKDEISGGSGNDILRGGTGADTFIFELTSDFDTIRDFGNGQDRLDVSAYGFASKADVIAAASQVGNSVRIVLSEDDAIKLNNFQIADLDAGDLII